MENTPLSPELEAVYRNDPAADGRFVYAVTTTRIYCRPSCRSRPPRPENVRFYATAGDAERDGFRPCKRCAPRDALDPPSPDRELDAARDFLRERCTGPVTWEEAASRAHLSPSRFHRLFHHRFGVPPAQFLARCRVEAACALLQHGEESVLRISLESGFGSPAAFYRAFRRHAGSSPAAYRRHHQEDHP